MHDLSHGIDQALSSLGGESYNARLARRIARVYEMYAKVIEKVCRKSGPLLLEHTNAVYIKREEEKERLIVYVDESIYAAELNASRELIRLTFLQMFNEPIEAFDILVSKGDYRKKYPYRQEEDDGSEEVKTRPLTDRDYEFAEKLVQDIEDNKLKESIKRAVLANLRLN